MSIAQLPQAKAIQILCFHSDFARSNVSLTLLLILPPSIFNFQDLLPSLLPQSKQKEFPQGPSPPTSITLIFLPVFHALSSFTGMTSALYLHLWTRAYPSFLPKTIGPGNSSASSISPPHSIPTNIVNMLHSPI